jgi:polyferredoxin
MSANRNLLDNRAVAATLKSRWYPGILQIPTAAIFIIIVYQLVLGPASAHKNLGTALTWVLWWPLIPIIFVVFGRFWCAICPFGTLSDLVQKFVGNQRPVPAFLKKYGIWIIDALFILITWGDHVWGIVENPWGSGVLLLGLTTGVVVSGAFFQRRTWCRYLCFLGGLSGNYARAGMLQLRANTDICATCKSKAACFNGNEKGPGCPMFEFPRTMDTNARCTLCAACVKTCPNGAITLSWRKPTKELWFIRNPKFEEAFLAAVIMGIVFVQNFTMLEVWEPILGSLQTVTGTDSYAVNFTITFIIAMALPIGLLMAAAAAARKFNKDTFVGNFAKFGYAIIPLDIAGHIAHNLFHLLAEGKAVVYTALETAGQQVEAGSTALVSTPVIQMLQYGLIFLGVLASLYTVFRISKNNYQLGTVNSANGTVVGSKHVAWATVVPYAALIAVFGVINIVLFVLPMAMRM